MSEQLKCSLCGGSGIVEDPQHGHSLICPKCGGKGWIKEIDDRR